MKRVVITGATGFLGGALAMRFLKNNVKVYGVGTNEEKFERFTSFKNFVPIIARFEDYPKLSEIILERDFDVFYHFAWQGVFGHSFQNYTLQLKNA